MDKPAMPSPASDTAADPVAILRQRLDDALALLDVTLQSPSWASQAARRQVNQLGYALDTARSALRRARELAMRN
jgi:hypothetical protein